MKQSFMAINQYGETVHGLEHPRKDLLNREYAHHADKMYQDKKDGTTVHVGYIIKGNWWTVYKVERMENKVN